jgi:hypothetical protein
MKRASRGTPRFIKGIKLYASTGMVAVPLREPWMLPGNLGV